MNPDGSGQTPALAAGSTPAWSPDGTRIVFARYPNVYSIAPDGTDEQLEFDGTGYCIDEPDWQPVPVITSSTHVRPVGATPFRSRWCPSQAVHSTESHPRPAIGVPVLQSAPARLTEPDRGCRRRQPCVREVGGLLRMDVIVGAPGPPDTSDVSIRLRLTNVMNLSGLSDYTGELQARLVQRLTSRNAAAGPGLGDVRGHAVRFAVPCAATADTPLGGLCSIQTTMDAVRPGLAAERDALSRRWARSTCTTAARTATPTRRATTPCSRRRASSSRSAQPAAISTTPASARQRLPARRGAGARPARRRPAPRS